MSAIELLRQIRTVEPGTPSLMITGAADGGSVVKAKSAGVTGHIRKPISAGELQKKMRVLSRIVAHRRSAVA